MPHKPQAESRRPTQQLQSRQSENHLTLPNSVPSHDKPEVAPNAHSIVKEARNSRSSPQPRSDAVIPPLLIKLWRDTGKHRHTWWQTHPALWQSRVYPAPPGWPDWQDLFPVIKSTGKPAIEDRVGELARRPRPNAGRAKEILKEREADVQKENTALKMMGLPKRDPPLRDFQMAKQIAEMKDDLVAMARKQMELSEAKRAMNDDFVTTGDVKVTVRKVVNNAMEPSGQIGVPERQ